MSTELGKQAEQLAADWLKSHRFKILVQNWRNRWCEIDIVARKGEVLHFVEVKYRKSDKFGAGFEYVTADKQNRLRQAAIAWLHQYKSSEAQYQIDVLSVAGSIKNPVIEYLPNAVQDSSMV